MLSVCGIIETYANNSKSIIYKTIEISINLLLQALRLSIKALQSLMCKYSAKPSPVKSIC